MRKLLVVLGGLAAAVACPSRSVRSNNPGSPGAATPTAAVENFLAAIRAQDLQALSNAWGTAEGPIRDNSRIDRPQLEKRELILICYFNNDKSRIVNETPGEGGRRILRVSLTKGNLTRETTFKTVPGPASRWYVEEADITAMKDFCASPPPAR